MVKKQRDVDKSIIITAIIGLVIIELFAMYKGINGTMRAIIFAMIAGLAGLSMPQLKILNK